VHFKVSGQPRIADLQIASLPGLLHASQKKVHLFTAGELFLAINH